MDAVEQGQDSAPYEDGDYSTGTVTDYEDWLDEDGEHHAVTVGRFELVVGRHGALLDVRAA